MLMESRSGRGRRYPRCDERLRDREEKMVTEFTERISKLFVAAKNAQCAYHASCLSKNRTICDGKNDFLKKYQQACKALHEAMRVVVGNNRVVLLYGPEYQEGVFVVRSLYLTTGGRFVEAAQSVDPVAWETIDVLLADRVTVK